MISTRSNAQRRRESELLGVECQASRANYADLEALIAGVGPALLRVQLGDPKAPRGWLLVLRSGRRRA